MAIALKQAQLAVSRGQTPFGAAVVDSEGNWWARATTAFVQISIPPHTVKS